MKKRHMIYTFNVLSLLGTGCIIKKKQNQVEKNQSAVKSTSTTGIDSDILLDINDVSILFTKENTPNSPKVYPDIPVTSPVNGQKKWPLAKDPSGDQGTIWEKNLFDEVIRLAGTQDTQVKNSSGRRANNFQINFFNPPSIGAWRIVGFRFIPCVLTSKVIESGEISIPSPGCVTQIRLIAQPMDSTNNNDLEDIAVHLVYSFDLFPTKAQTTALLSSLNAQLQTPSLPDAAKAAISQQIGLIQRFDGSAFSTRLDVAKAMAAHPQIGPMIADLQKIKTLTKTLVDTNGRPLGAHPGLVAEVQKGSTSAQPGPIALSIKDFLTNHLSSFHLSNISFMGLNNGGPEPWLFFGGDMGRAPTGPATPTFIQTAIGSDWVPHKKLTYRLKGVFPSEQPPRPEKAIALSFITSDAVIPAPKAVGHLAGLFGPNDNIDSNPAHMVDNPNLINNFNADCVSCHVGTTRMNTLSNANLGTRTAKAKNPNRFKSVPGISGYVDPSFMSRTQWNVRNFGFFAEANDPEARPKVTFRVLNESIDSTELTNQVIFSVASDDLTTIQHPGLKCTDDDATWECTLNNAGNCFRACSITKTSEPAPTPISTPKVGDGDGKQPNPGGQDPVPNVPPTICKLTTSPAQVRGPNGNVIFTASTGVSLPIVTMPNTPQGSTGVAVDVIVRDDLLTCDPNDLCRAFPEPAPNADQKDALLPIQFNNNGAIGANLGTAKNAAFLGTLKPTADRRNRTGVLTGFVTSASCK